MKTDLDEDDFVKNQRIRIQRNSDVHTKTFMVVSDIFVVQIVGKNLKGWLRWRKA